MFLSSATDSVGRQGRNDTFIVVLKIYDVLGREIQTLVNQNQKPGIYSVDWNAENLSAGIYFYRLKVSNEGGNLEYDFIETKKMVLLK